MSTGLLLDTCTFLWMVRTPNDLSPAARDAVVDPSRPLFLSVASHWEIGVKSQIGRLALPDEPGIYLRRERARHGIESLTSASKRAPLITSASCPTYTAISLIEC